MKMKKDVQCAQTRRKEISEERKNERKGLNLLI